MRRAIAAVVSASLALSGAGPAFAASAADGGPVPASPRDAGAPVLRLESIGMPAAAQGLAPQGFLPLDAAPPQAPETPAQAGEAAAAAAQPAPPAAPASVQSGSAAEPAARAAEGLASLADAARRGEDDPEQAWQQLLRERAAQAAASETAAGGAARGPLLQRAASGARRVWKDHIRSPLDVFFFGDPEIREHVRKYDARIWTASALHILAGASTIAQIKLFGMMVDAMIHAQGQWFLTLISSYLALHVAAIFVGSFRDVWLNWTKLSLGHDVRAALFKKLMARDPQFFGAHPPSELATRLLNDAGQVMLRNVDGRVTIPYDLAMAGMATFMMFHTSMTFGGLVAVPMLAVVWLFLRYGQKQEANERVATRVRAEASKEAERRLSSFREAMRVGDAALERLVAGYEKVSDDLRSIWYRIGKTATVNDYLLGFLSYFPVHFLVYGLGGANLFGAIKWFGTLTVGQIQAFAGFANEFRNGVQGLLYVIVKDFRVAKGQTSTVLEWMAHPDPAPLPVEPDPLRRASAALGAEIGNAKRVGVTESSGQGLRQVADKLAGPGTAWIDARTSWLPGSVALNLRDGGPMADDAAVEAALKAAGAEFLLKPVKLADGSIHRTGLELEAAQATEHFGEGPMRRALLARLILQDPKVVVVSNPEGHLAGRDLEAFGHALTRALADRTVIWLWPRAEMYGAFDKMLSIAAR